MPKNFRNDTKAVLTEFNTPQGFETLQQACLTITLITKGKAELTVNDKAIVLTAPCIFLSSGYDKIHVIHKIVSAENNRLTAKSFGFHPSLLNKDFTFENLFDNGFNDLASEHDYSLIKPFISRDDHYMGGIKPSPQTFFDISKCFDLAYNESKTQSIIKSGIYWHRIRRYLLLILLLLDDSCPNNGSNLSGESMIDIVLEYIHSNFSKDISLDTLCRLVYVNRTTLSRKFKAHTKRAPIDYILQYRLKIACELLTHSALSISKIAEATGFKYESYFTRQFTAKMGMTPTQYRQSDGFEMLNIGKTQILNEF